MLNSIKINVYIAAVAIAGWTAMAQSIMHWHTGNWAGFVIFLGVSMLASGFKLRLPGITGTVSAAFFPALIGIVYLSAPEALTVACAAVLTQCVWQSRKRQLIKIVFNVSNAALAVGSTAAVFHSQVLQTQNLEFAVRLAILGGTYFVANTLPVCGIIALTERKPVFAVWRDNCCWSLPLYLVGSAAGGLFVLTSQYLGWQTALLFLPLSFLLYRSCSLHVTRVNDAKTHAEETVELYLRTITSLAAAIEAKDCETHNHLQRVRVYAMEIGKELRLSETELEALGAAALLHDIGKIAVPDHIIGKPGKLTPAEFQRMKIHPTVGAEILERARFPFPVAPIVRCHHEKWDGSGYPAGLKGEEIPIGARILAAVDCLDALASDRHYRRALPLDEAMAFVERDSGRAFDPRVVEVLTRSYVQLEQMARLGPVEQRLSTGIYIERGAAPAAGFEESRPRVVPQSELSPSHEVSDLARLQCFVDAVKAGGRFLSLRETLSIFTERLATVVSYDSVVVYVPRRGALMAIHAAGNHAAALRSIAIPLGQGVSGWAANANRPIVNGNAATELSHAMVPGGYEAPVSALALPLPGTMGPVGVLTLYGYAENAFATEDLNVLAALGPGLASYLESSSGEIESQYPLDLRLGVLKTPALSFSSDPLTPASQ